MNRTARFSSIIASSTLGLAACTAQPEPVSVEATSTMTHTVTPTPSSFPTTSPESAANPEENTQGTSFTPGDPGLISVDSIGTVGMFMDPDTGKYYVCNGGKVTRAQGAPVESGTCAGPFEDYYEAGQVTSRLADSLSAAIENFMDEEGLNTPVDEGEITNQFWDCIETGGTEETCLQ